MGKVEVLNVGLEKKKIVLYIYIGLFMNKILFFVFLLFPLLLISQNDTLITRIEFEHSFDGPYHYNATPVGSKGFVLTYPTAASTEDTTNLAVVLYDTTMQVTSVQQLNVPKFTEFVASYLEGEALHLLYIDGTDDTENSTWILVTYHLEENRFTTQVTPAYFATATTFRVENQYLIVTHEWEKGSDFIIYDLKRNALQFAFNNACNTKKVEIEFLQFDSRGKNLIAGLFIPEHPSDDKKMPKLLDISLISNEYQFTDFPAQEEINFVSAAYFSSSENTFMLAGGYHIKGEMYKRSRRLPFEHTGYYTMTAQANRGDNNLINFEFNQPKISKFDSITDFNGDGFVARSTNAAAIFYCAIGHTLVEEDRYTIVFEIYYPVISNSKDFGPTLHGYVYHQANIFTFNANGNLLNKYLLIYQRFLINSLPDAVTKLYKDENQQLYAHYIRGWNCYAKLEQKEGAQEWVRMENRPITFHPDDTKYRSTLERSSRWYGNTSFFSGYQKFKNKSFKKKSREIFYVAKVSKLHTEKVVK